MEFGLEISLRCARIRFGSLSSSSISGTRLPKKDWSRKKIRVEVILNQQYLYVASDVFADIAGDILVRHFIVRTSGVPRGLLRFLVLKLLAEKPMSGVEIVDEITNESGEKWKPSPGSIYPLLAQLQDKGYTEELPIEESGMKRYALTEEGVGFFEREIKSGQKFFKKLEYLAPMLLEGFQFGVNDEGLSEVRKSARRAAKTFIDLQAEIKDNFTKQEAKEITQIMNDCTRKLKKVTEKVRSRKNS